MSNINSQKFLVSIIATKAMELMTLLRELKKSGDRESLKHILGQLRSWIDKCNK
jgi:hypothetical protein